jgi:hypothetical protein
LGSSWAIAFSFLFNAFNKQASILRAALCRDQAGLFVCMQINMVGPVGQMHGRSLSRVSS